MNLRKLRQLELDEQKEKRKEEIIIAASEIFKSQGIDNTKMTDIAEKAQVGVATVYRYFKTKLDLALDAATYLWEQEINILYSNFYEETLKNLNGKDKLNTVLNVFIDIYLNYPETMSFLENFDNYIIKENISQEQLENYEKSIIDTKSIICSALNEGKKDGSINKDLNNDLFYITITHSLMSLSQKLILRGSILKSDKQISGDKQIKLLIDMAMNYIK